jgi:RNA recognition motif-containing protein
MERINMSLDDIMASKRAEAKTTKQNKSKPKPKVVKSNASARVAKVRQPPRAPQNERPVRVAESSVRINKPGQQAVGNNNRALSVFSRMGKPPVSGTRVTFANLKPSVREEDVRELCSSMGEIKDVEFSQGRGGKNTAIVLFARRSEALNCVGQLNGTQNLSRST